MTCSEYVLGKILLKAEVPKAQALVNREPERAKMAAKPPIFASDFEDEYDKLQCIWLTRSQKSKSPMSTSYQIALLQDIQCLLLR